MTWFLILTALTVSIDSFFCGFSLSLNSKKKIPIVLTITLTVLAMCFLTNYLTALFMQALTEKTSSLGGILLIAIGIYNFFKKESTLPKGKVLKQSLIIGVAVGLDGALANLSLSLMNINQFYVPMIIAFMHGIMIWLGIVLSQSKIMQKLKRASFFAPLILIGLGLYKLVGLFV